MLKVSFFTGQSNGVPSVIPLHTSADHVFEKLASPNLLPEVQVYIDSLKPRTNAQYVLASAMGASEYYGSNSNADAFLEASLIHAPDDWTGNPTLDKDKAKFWPYGFPTFYNAKVFLHHRNKNPDKSVGDVELAAWNPHMHRVELVMRLDRDRCAAFDGQGVWDKLKNGQCPDTSMGSRVPFDLCAACGDVPLYKEAWSTYVPGQHKHPGEAILKFHKELKAKDGVGIRGLSITRKDYCHDMLQSANRILPDGRKVCVYNDFPSFFDISLVFIGADKIAKVMLKIADNGKLVTRGSAEMAEILGVNYDENKLEKAASVEYIKKAKQKKSEIIKDVVPNQAAGKALPLLTANEPDLPTDALRGQSLESILSTTAGLGIVLKPSEFQKITLICSGKPELATQLEKTKQIFPATSESTPVGMDEGLFNPILARLLLEMLSSRSALGPFIERRALMLAESPKKEVDSPTSHPSPILNKIGAAYNGYRNQLMEFVAGTQGMLDKAAVVSDGEIYKLANADVHSLFTPLSVTYLAMAFLDEVPGYFTQNNATK